MSTIAVTQVSGRRPADRTSAVVLVDGAASLARCLATSGCESSPIRRRLERCGGKPHIHSSSGDRAARRTLTRPHGRPCFGKDIVVVVSSLDVVADICVPLGVRGSVQ